MNDDLAGNNDQFDGIDDLDLLWFAAATPFHQHGLSPLVEHYLHLVHKEPCMSAEHK
jgi:hypothetical protein